MLLKNIKVNILEGKTYLVDDHTIRMIQEHGGQTYSFNNLIIATGSRPIEIKGFEFEGRVIDSTGALNLKEIPKKLTVIGGGYIGMELAGVYANFGSEVTVIEASPQILPGFAKDMVKIVQDDLEKKGVTFITEARAKSVNNLKTKATVTYEVDGKEDKIDSDYVLVSVGRRPNTDELGLELAGVKLDDRGLIEVDEQCRTNKPNIYAIGDVVAGPALAHKASYEAKVAAEVISGSKGAAVDYLAMPEVTFTDPELAQVGYAKKEAEELGYDVRESKFPLAAHGRAQYCNQTE